MALLRYIALAYLIFGFAASGHGNEYYVPWDGVGSVAVIYDMPFEKLEQRVLRTISILPDLESAKSAMQFVSVPDFDGTDNVLKAPPNTTVKELLLGWVPDPKKMTLIPGDWKEGSTRHSTVFLTIGYNRSNPSLSFLIFSREWSVKSESSIPRTGIRLPVKMWTRWPQLLKADARFFEGVSDGSRSTLIERGTIFDERLRAALDQKTEKTSD